LQQVIADPGSIQGAINDRGHIRLSDGDIIATIPQGTEAGAERTGHSQEAGAERTGRSYFERHPPSLSLISSVNPSFGFLSFVTIPQYQFDLYHYPLLLYVQEKGRINNSVVQQLCGLSKPKATRYLSEPEKEKYLH
jgi:hypothetical protein